jgi:hypothetical protein
MLNGAAGHTYGAGGLWQMNSESVRGAKYEFTPWSEAMHLPGSTQLGLGKRLLEHYPWWRFQPHPEWVEPHSATLLEPHVQWSEDAKEFAARGGKWDLPYAAGIPGEVRVIYIPGHYYSWAAPTVKHLERDLPYHACYFNPGTGQSYDLGLVLSSGPPPKRFEGHTSPRLFEDRFQRADAPAWKDYGTPTQRKDGRLVGTKGMVTILDQVNDADLMASADARSDAEAGLILRFHSPDHYLVALYTPLLKTIYLHDRRNGQWGEPFGKVAVPDLGPKIHLVAAACGDHAAMLLTDGQRNYHTPIVHVDSTNPGKVGLWLFQVGDRQEYRNFELSRAQFGPAKEAAGSPALDALKGRARGLPLVLAENPGVVPAVRIPEVLSLATDDYTPPRLPAPQDWVLVLEARR